MMIWHKKHRFPSKKNMMFCSNLKKHGQYISSKKRADCKNSFLLKFLPGASSELAKDPAHPYLFGVSEQRG
jgi:hypothetical protein